MAEEALIMDMETTDQSAQAGDVAIPRVYEVGYHISPSVDEADVEKVVADIRTLVEKNGGTFIAEGAPVLTKLAFPIDGLESGKKIEHDRGYFGWLKFESPLETAEMLRETLMTHTAIFRFIVFRTVREETRARMKAPQLREVKRTDTPKAAPRKAEESAPISEVDLDKALQDITTD